MKTQKPRIIQIGFFYICLAIGPLLTLAQGEPSSDEETLPVDPRPALSDAASIQLIKNYLVVTGGKEAHLALRNVVAEGKIKESTLERNFRLIETIDGKRHLTYYWTHKGRKNRVIYVFDGIQSWKQVIEPKKKEAMLYGGADATHFANNRWLVQPFTLPMLADYVFKYQGTSRVNGRPAHIIKGYGKKDTHNWFYFDKEKFLLIRWGGKGMIAGISENMDYRATQFKSIDGVMLPAKIELLAEDSAFGHLHFEKIEINQDLSDISFFMPQSTVPILRQRSAATN